MDKYLNQTEAYVSASNQLLVFLDKEGQGATRAVLMFIVNAVTVMRAQLEDMSQYPALDEQRVIFEQLIAKYEETLINIELYCGLCLQRGYTKEETLKEVSEMLHKLYEASIVTVNLGNSFLDCLDKKDGEDS